MPSLLRFLFVVAVLVGGGYAALYALAYHTHPQPRQITVIIPPSHLNKHR
jgi:phage shock protein PspC (stress-responsive transcriptional regulator)